MSNEVGQGRWSVFCSSVIIEVELLASGSQQTVEFLSVSNPT